MEHLVIFVLGFWLAWVIKDGPIGPITKWWRRHLAKSYAKSPESKWHIDH